MFELMLSAHLSHLHQKQTEAVSETKSYRGVEVGQELGIA